MKKLLSLAIIAIICSVQASAQDIKVNYQKGRSAEMNKLMRVMDVESFNIEITGDFAGKKILLVKHHVMGKRIVKSKTTMLENAKDNTLKIDVWTRKLNANRAKIEVYCSTFQWSTEEDVRSNQTHILMETYKDDITANEIPIFAFTTGIKKKITDNGKQLDTVDYVSLRDSKIAPLSWGENFKLPPYIYYSLEVE